MWVQGGPLLVRSIGLKLYKWPKIKRVNGVKFDPTYGGPHVPPLTTGSWAYLVSASYVSSRVD